MVIGTEQGTPNPLEVTNPDPLCFDYWTTGDPFRCRGPTPHLVLRVLDISGSPTEHLWQSRPIHFLLGEGEMFECQGKPDGPLPL